MSLLFLAHTAETERGDADNMVESMPIANVVGTSSETIHTEGVSLICSKSSSSFPSHPSFCGQCLPRAEPE
jgi:hypothetical protein